MINKYSVCVPEQLFPVVHNSIVVPFLALVPRDQDYEKQFRLHDFVILFREAKHLTATSMIRKIMVKILMP